MLAIKPLYVALIAMFLQQSFATMAKIVVPIIAAVAFPALGVDASNVGIFTGFYSLCQVIIVLFCGNLIGGRRRHRWRNRGWMMSIRRHRHPA